MGASLTASVPLPAALTMMMSEFPLGGFNRRGCRSACDEKGRDAVYSAIHRSQYDDRVWALVPIVFCLSHHCSSI
jgi:hypothetical protein